MNRTGIRELHRRVSLSCEACVGDSYELILVNDGSKDATWQIMRELCRSDKHVVAINLSPTMAINSPFPPDCRCVEAKGFSSWMRIFRTRPNCCLR